MQMNDYIGTALSLGFTQAVVLNKLELECEARIREYCNSKQCQKYGNNWVCPPGSGTLSECAERINRYKSGILMQSVTALNPPVEPDEYHKLNRLHNEGLRRFIEQMEERNEHTLALTNGGCILCEACAYPKPCIKPNLRMHSLSAYGIDVGKLCDLANLDFYFRPDRVQYVALVLFENMK